MGGEGSARGKVRGEREEEPVKEGEKNLEERRGGRDKERGEWKGYRWGGVE